jgi:hypothetical protein
MRYGWIIIALISLGLGLAVGLGTSFLGGVATVMISAGVMLAIYRVWDLF